jgi:hypothetical protein
MRSHTIHTQYVAAARRASALGFLVAITAAGTVYLMVMSDTAFTISGFALIGLAFAYESARKRAATLHEVYRMTASLEYGWAHEARH